jgi:hypothetical protein
VIIKDDNFKEKNIEKKLSKSQFFCSPTQEKDNNKNFSFLQHKNLKKSKEIEENVSTSNDFDNTKLSSQLSSHFNVFSESHFPVLNEKLDLLISYSKPKVDIILDNLEKEKEKVEHLRNQCVNFFVFF